jgi:hypothetical protein
VHKLSASRAWWDMAVRPLTRRALRLQSQGRYRGKAWRPIIRQLGFDPRSFNQGTLTLGQENGRLTPGTGTFRAPFQPFKAPTTPPTGTYDPALDAQVEASKRGLADLVMDTDTNRSRLASDYGLAVAGIQRQTQLTGQQQAGQQRAQGIRGGGVLAAAMVRAENQQRAIDPLSLNYARQNEDMTTGLSRAQRENTQFGLDVTAQRFFQATQSGWKAPTAPKNEKTKNGVTYRVRGEGPGRKYTLPSGRVLGRQEWVNMWRKRRASGAFPAGYGIGGV